MTSKTPKVLVINCGSSSIKYALYESEGSQVLASGIVARVGDDESYLEHNKEKFVQPLPSHREGFAAIIDTLLDSEHGVIAAIDEIVAVGHRVVHGGDVFTESTLITDEVVAKIEECIPLAPLHNPPNLLGIREAMNLLPGVPNVAVFDTSYHQGIPERAFMYALPYELYERQKVRRYGFHGTSFRYVSQAAAAYLERPIDELRMVICHLGNGSSMSALNCGVPADTSMGMTPLEGLVMGTRSGDVDPGVIFFLTGQLGMVPEEVDTLLNKQSGLKGIGGSNDVRDLTEKAAGGDKRAELALEVFAYRIKKYVGAYTAAMGGLDALVFTGGIGENADNVRSMICSDLDVLGVELSPEANAERSGGKRRLGTAGSKVEILVVPTDEESMIFHDTLTIAESTLAAASR